ncbi:MFS transporter [Propionicimonas sp.]|uniref:MFS transporter n=1 Tax=Propionicimonas sp. TaxID=1955623 RepID=UPI0039E64DD1
MSTSLASRQAAAAVVLLFAYNGLVIGSYAASIPTLTARFGLQAWQLSIFFICMGLAAIASMQLSGRLSDRFGARRVSIAMIPVLILAILAIGLAPSVPMLFVAGILLGIGNGGIDVAMNAIGVQVEQNRPRPIMSFFHGMWSVGNLIGAGLLVLLGAVLGQADPTVVATCSTAAALGVVALVLAWRITPETVVIAHTDASGTRTPIPRSAYLLGLMAIAFGLGEGTANDWSGLHVTQLTGVDPTTGALGYTCVVAFMVVIRLLGDGLVTRFGRRAVTMFGGACSALGYLVAATGSGLPVLLVGWSLVGLGIGMIAPQVYAVAGHTAGGRGLAVVVTFGYATFLVAPGIIGWLVGAIGIQHTMFVPTVLLAGLLLVARIMPGKDAALVPAPEAETSWTDPA